MSRKDSSTSEVRAVYVESDIQGEQSHLSCIYSRGS